MAAPYPLVHVYPQSFPHDPLSIVGTREGLLTLLDTILGVLLPDRAPFKVSSAFCGDGEGYDIVVHLESEEALETQYCMPYTSAPYVEDQRSPTWPRRESP